MEILLANNVNIDQEVPQLGTPLYVACTHKRVDCVKKLLELGNFQKSYHEKGPINLVGFPLLQRQSSSQAGQNSGSIWYLNAWNRTLEKWVSMFFSPLEIGSIYLVWVSLVVSRENKSLFPI